MSFARGQKPTLQACVGQKKELEKKITLPERPAAQDSETAWMRFPNLTCVNQKILAIRPRSDTDFSLARVAVRRKDIVHLVVAFAPFSHGSAMRAQAKFMVDAFAMTH